MRQKNQQKRKAKILGGEAVVRPMVGRTAPPKKPTDERQLNTAERPVHLRLGTDRRNDHRH